MKKKLLLQDIVDFIAQHEGLNPDEADAFVRAFFDIVEQGLQEDKIVKIKGLGTFKLVAVSERESVNINTGERFQIEGHSKVSFTPDNSMKELINRPFAHFEAVELSEDTDAEEFNEVDKEVELEFENSEDDTDDEEDDSSELEEDDKADEENVADDEAADNTPSEMPTASEPEPSITPESAASIPFEIENTLESQEEEQKQILSTEVAIEPEQSTPSVTEEHTEPSSLPDSIELDTQAPTENPQQATGMQENSADETTQPTTIAPTDLANTNDIMETAKVRIDSNEEETEADDTPKAESISKNSSEVSDSSDNTEEEIVVTPPRPITSEHQGPHTSHTMGYAYVEVPSRRKVNWWKRGVLTFLFLLLLVLSYFAGYYNILCPCSLPGMNKDVTEAPQKVSANQAETTQQLREKETAEESLQPDATETQELTADEGVQKEVKAATQTSESEPAEKKHAEQADEPKKSSVKTTEKKVEQPAESPKKKAQIQKKSETKSQPAKTVRTHTVKVGDTLYKIARKYYGNEDAIHQIIKYNNLKDADHIQLGMTLKLP